MKILFITKSFPYPTDSGGRIRTYYILKGLSQEHDITLLTTIEHEEQRMLIPELLKVCSKVKVIKTRVETLLQLVGKIIKNCFSQIPIVVERHYLKEVADEVNAQIHEAQPKFDIIHFDHLDTSIYLDCIPATMTTVLDEHNIVSNQVKTSALVERNFLKRFYMDIQLKKTLRYEASVCRKITRCFVCSDVDKRYLLRMAKDAHVVSVPNGVDVEYFGGKSWIVGSQHKFSQDIPTIIFVGTLDYGPGGTAVRYFCEDIFPLIQLNVPDVRFLVVGQNPPKYLQLLAEQNKNIVLTGRVDDIRPYVAQAQVFVVPLQSGSGTRLKILDAMAMNIPVVSTSIGAEGLAVCSGEHLFITDTPAAFGAAVSQLLQDLSLADNIRENASQLVQTKYSWKTIWKDLLKNYEELGE